MSSPKGTEAVAQIGTPASESETGLATLLPRRPTSNSQHSLQRLPTVRPNRYRSMPKMEASTTCLRPVAGLGLTNFQLLQTMTASVFLLHAADAAMFPGVFKALEEGVSGVNPVSLGVIVFVEAICHSIAVLVWGVLADRGCKLTLLMQATLALGVLTLATACVTNMITLVAVRALAGIVGAALGPLSQGLIGAICPPSERGRAFGFLIACGQGGHGLGLLLACSTSHLEAIGGWRGSFVIFALFTLVLAWALAMVQKEVSHGYLAESRTWAQLAENQESGSSRSSVWDVLKELAENAATILRRHSFLVLILQGAFASTTVRAMQYQVMWYQYLGFSDLVASSMTSAAPLGCIVGALVSGFLSDAMAGWFPNHGRILFGQLADLGKLLVLFVTFVVCGAPNPENASAAFLMGSLSFLFGFVSIQAYVGAVKPLFAEIVPAQLIAQVIAMAAAIDGAFSSFAGMPVVGFITQNVFHYQETTLKVKDMPEDLRTSNAAALGHAIAGVTMTSACLTIVSFGLLHITYPRDCAASLAEDQMRAVEEEASTTIARSSSPVHSFGMLEMSE